jgi:integrase
MAMTQTAIADLAGVYRRCGCVDPSCGRRYGNRCPRLTDPNHGSWYFAIQATNRRGRRIRLRRGGYPTADGAVEARAAARARADRGPFDEVTTVRGWLYTWLAMISGTVRATTWQSYQSHVEQYLSPGIGRIPLDQLTTGHIQRLFDALAVRLNRHAAPLSPATLQRVRATVRRALNVAVRERVLPGNPALGLILPDLRRSRPTVWSATRIEAWRQTGWRPAVSVWTPQLLGEFLDRVGDDPLYALWHLAALSGLRRGELLGLRWIDLDLDRRELTVARQRVETPGQILDSEPKTQAGFRTIALDADTATTLAKHQQSRWSSPEADGYVFCWPDRRPLRPDWLTHRFTHLVRQLDLPPIRLHDLRHGAATLALAIGTDIRIVQEMLGHTSYAFTADIYTSVLSTQSREAAAAIAASVRACRRTVQDGRAARRPRDRGDL